MLALELTSRKLIAIMNKRMTVSNKLPRWLKTHPLELLDAPWLEDTFELSLLTDILLPLSLSEPSSDEDRSGENDDVFGTW